MPQLALEDHFISQPDPSQRRPPRPESAPWTTTGPRGPETAQTAGDLPVGTSVHSAVHDIGPERLLNAREVAA